MNLDAAIRKLDSAIAGLSSIVADRVIVAGNDAAALIISRIRETGKDEKGNPFQPDYTPQYKRRKAGLTVKKIKRAQSIFEKRLNEGTLGTKKSDTKLADTAVGIRGRYKGYVDFSLTNRMLNNIGIVEEKETKSTVRIKIAPKAEEEKKKFEGNVKRRGEILRLSKEEQTAVSSAFYQSVEVKLKQLMP